jgi:hypothetical protein
MKKIKLFFYIVILTIFCLNIAGCEDEDTNYQEAILGKWELIETGQDENSMKPVKSTGSYLNFLQNNKMQHYDPITNEYDIEQTYKIDSKFLYYHYENGINNSVLYKYHFYEDKLKLTIVSANFTDIFRPDGIPFVVIYKRIK